MRSSRTFSHTIIVAGQLALLTLALASCGRQAVPEAPIGQMTPETTAAQTTETQPAQTAAQIMTVSVRAGTTEADLISRYPGSRVLALHASESYAQLLSTGATAAAPAMGSLSLNAQLVTVTATEPDITLATSVTDDMATAQGNSVWASGNGVWASGNGVWASGTNTGGSINALAANAPTWTKLDLGNGQKLAPLLGQGIKVAVLDTGIDIAHPAFSGHLDVASGWDYVGGDAIPQEENWATSGFSASYGHGTAVAGVILQVAPNATIIPYRVLAPNGAGRLSNIIMAVNDATKYGAKVINMSLGTIMPSVALNTAIKSAISSGVMVVASSGNSGDSNVSYPARYAPDMQLALGGGLISVGSINLGDKKSSFSTCGLSLDMLAPGEAVVTTFPNGQLTSATGTSFAAPMVSGAVALAMSKGRTNVVALYKSMKLSATAPTDPLFWSQMGSGTLNIGKLMVTP